MSIPQVADNTTNQEFPKVFWGLDKPFLRLIESMQKGIYATDPTGKLFFVNKAFVDILGYTSKEEVLGRFIMEELFADANEGQKFIRQIRECGFVYEYENLKIRPDGKRMILSTNGNLMNDAQGHVIGIEGMVWDITEHTQMASQLKKLSVAVEQSPSSIVITDKHGNIEYVNPKFTQLTGYMPQEVLGKNPRILKSDATPPEEYRKLWKTITAGGEWHGEFHNKKKNGEPFWEYASISPISDVSGEITHFISVNEDITERKNTEEALRLSQAELKDALAKEKDAYHRLQEVDNMKSDFISIVSHELRTPLTAIRNAVSILLKNHDRRLAQDHEQELLDIILKNTDRQTRMINDLLDIAKIEAGVFKMQKENLNLTALVTEVISSLEIQTTNKHIKRILSAPPDPLWIYADADQIRRVFNNLYMNALKFTPPHGEIFIHLRKEEDHVCAQVKDTGIGISRDDINMLFKKFYKLEKGQKHNYTGTGLGLVITKGIIEAHGGEIGVSSQVGRGTVFYFNLPISGESTNVHVNAAKGGMT